MSHLRQLHLEITRSKLPGAKPRQDPILIGAHFDAVPGSLGADDNASGLAVLLELARHFAADPACSPLWLVAFDFDLILIWRSEVCWAVLPKRNSSNGGGSPYA
ncbi:MAG: M28 family peptidase [Cyanobacteriota bacterium]